MSIQGKEGADFPASSFPSYPECMITFPNSKINLGLNVVEKRPDGYHNIETIFYPIPLQDALEVIPHPAGPAHLPASEKMRLHLSGIPVAGDPRHNLVAKAYCLLDDICHLPPVDVYLYKHIPSGAGLGGGSADAAFMLKMLNELFSLGLPEDELEKQAARLGADCPFFIRNRPTYAEGRGDRFTPVSLSLAGLHCVVVKPPVFVSTRDAFSHITPQRPRTSARDIVRLPVSRWRNMLVNDFERSVFALHPSLAAIKEDLYRRGAAYAAMSGSGSSVFGLWPSRILPRTEGLADIAWRGVLE